VFSVRIEHEIYIQKVRELNQIMFLPLPTSLPATAAVLDDHHYPKPGAWLINLLNQLILWKYKLAKKYDATSSGIAVFVASSCFLHFILSPFHHCKVISGRTRV
jgi:hypothetical protein